LGFPTPSNRRKEAEWGQGAAKRKRAGEYSVRRSSDNEKKFIPKLDIHNKRKKK